MVAGIDSFFPEGNKSGVNVLHVVGELGGLGCFDGSFGSQEDEAGEGRENRDDDEEFDQGKALGAARSADGHNFRASLEKSGRGVKV